MSGSKHDGAFHENILVLNGTPYQMAGRVQTRLRYRALLWIGVNMGDKVAVKLKDSFGNPKSTMQSDYAFLHAMENGKLPVLRRLVITDSDGRRSDTQIAWATNHTLIVALTDCTKTELRTMQAEQFGMPTDAKVIELRAIDEACEWKVQGIQAEVERLQKELDAANAKLTTAKAELRAARAATSDAERRADHVELLTGDADYAAAREGCEFTLLSKAEAEDREDFDWSPLA